MLTQDQTRVALAALRHVEAASDSDDPDSEILREAIAALQTQDEQRALAEALLTDGVHEAISNAVYAAAGGDLDPDGDLGPLFDDGAFSVGLYVDPGC